MANQPIDPRKIHSYFATNFTLKKSSQGWWIFDCPMCGEADRKCAVQPYYGFVKCWKCSLRMSAVDFVKDYEGYEYGRAKDVLHNAKASDISETYKADSAINPLTQGAHIELPFGFKSLMEGEGIIGKRARSYLAGRGFNIKAMDFEGFGYCNERHEDYKEDYFGYIIIPFKKDGRLVYYQGRDFLESRGLRYKNPSKEACGIGKSDLFYNADALNIYSEVAILEGWADAKTLGDHVMSSQGWQLSPFQKNEILTSQVDIVTFVPDAGVDGEGISFYDKAVKTAMDFVEDKIVRVADLNGIAGGKDVNDLGAGFVQDIINKTPFLDYETGVKILMG